MGAPEKRSRKVVEGSLVSSSSIDDQANGNANDLKIPEVQQKELDKHANDILKTIQTERPDHRFAIQDEFVIETVTCALFGLENYIIQKVQNPDVMLVGGHFLDAVAATAIEHLHRYPKLLESPTFKTLCNKFLRAVVSWDGKG